MVDIALILVSLGFGIGMGFMVRYFTGIYEAQFAITDKLIHKVNDLRSEVAQLRGYNRELVDDFDITGNEVMQRITDDDSERTHILGGFVHGDAVCSDNCWCKGEEE